MRALIVLIGEAFRDVENNKDKKRGLPHTYDDQMVACKSHIEFINMLSTKYNIVADVVVDTYTTQYDSDLINIYMPHLKHNHFHPYLLGWDNIYFHSLTIIKDILDDYDFVHYFRIDLFLKPFFINNFVYINKVRFSSVCFTKSNYHLYNGLPRIADMMVYVPKLYYRLFHDRTYLLIHEAYSVLLRFNVPRNDITFYTPTYHDSNTMLDWNPLYRVVNRPEATTWHDKGLMYDEETDTHKVEYHDFPFKVMEPDGSLTNPP